MKTVLHRVDERQNVEIQIKNVLHSKIHYVSLIKSPLMNAGYTKMST
jgi:hypothetical protein